MVACDSCNRWYHYECVELTQKKLARLPTWLCQRCTAGDTFSLEQLATLRRGTQIWRQAKKELRRALGDDAAQPRYIETVSGQGYRFVSEVEVA